MTNEWLHADLLPIGTADFTLSAWIRLPGGPMSNPGDVLAAFDTTERRGLVLEFLDSSPCGNHGISDPPTRTPST